MRETGKKSYSSGFKFQSQKIIFLLPVLPEVHQRSKVDGRYKGNQCIKASLLR